MANVFTRTAGKAWRFGGPNQKSLLRIEGTLVIDTTATGGAVAGDLPATLFGLLNISGVATINISDDSKSYIGVPSYDGLSLMVGGGAANAAMDLPNGTYKVSLQGNS